MTKGKKGIYIPKCRKISFKVKETIITTQPKCMPINLAEEKKKFMQFGEAPQFQLQDPSQLEEVADKARNRIRFDLQGEALYILEHVLNEYGDGEAFLECSYGPRISKEEATPLLLKYITENSLSESMTIHWCDNLSCSAKMMWKGPVVNCNRPDLRKYSLWINGCDENRYMRESGIRCLMDHEIGTHFFRMLNDGFQPWFSDRAKFGLRRSGSFESKCSEEGLATINTILRGRVKLLWCAAFAYYTACKSAEMTFKQLFDHLGRYTNNPNYRWKQVMRIKRGLKDPNDLGGLGNDQCYFEGAVNILRNMENIDFYLLMSGKVCYDELERIKRVVRKECLRYPTFMHNIVSYKKTLLKIRELNGLNQQHPTQEPPSAYLLRLIERKASSSVEEETKPCKKTVKSKAHENNQTCKSLKKKLHIKNDFCDDCNSEVDGFTVSNNFTSLRTFKLEEAKRNKETNQIYKRFEHETNKLSLLDATFEQKVKDLKNIVKEHNWSNSDNGYKESLFNQASFELLHDKYLSLGNMCPLVDFAVTMRTESGDASVQSTALLPLQQPISELIKSNPKNIKSKKSFANTNFNSNSCMCRFFKKRQTFKSVVVNREKPISPSKPCQRKQKKKADILTDALISENAAEMKKKFSSEVNPYEIILLEMTDIEEDNDTSGEAAQNSNLPDPSDSATSEAVVQTSAQGIVDAASDSSRHNSQLELQADVKKLQSTSSLKQRTNFISRNKLLLKRSSLNSDKPAKVGSCLDKNNDNNNETDSDASSMGHKKTNVNAHIVSQYSQFKPVIVQKQKSDRDILTADLCKPLFMQAERLLQAEKVLKKVRSRKVNQSCKSYFPTLH